MQPDLDRIRQLIRLAEETGLVELEVRWGDQSVRFVRAGQPAPAVEAGVAAVARMAQRGAEPVGETVFAPLAGTFYARPAPDAAPFVALGDRVAAGAVLCIIESMKMLNEIRADRAGTVVAVHGVDGEPVGTGDPLFRLA